MFETAEVGRTASKAHYKRREGELRTALLDAQLQLAASRRAAVIVVGGAEGAGKEDVVDLIVSWLDARGLETHAMWDTTDEERMRPPYWRFWRVLPPRGKLAILFGSWYTAPIIDRVFDRSDEARLEHECHRIVDFERMLDAEGISVIKFWLHLQKDVQAEHLKALKKDKRTRWRVNKATWEFFELYDDFRRVSENALRQTSTGFSPWHIVEAADWRYRNLTVAETLLQRLERALERDESEAAAPAPEREPLPAAADVNVISQLDQKTRVAAKDYDQRLPELQGKLAKHVRKLHERERSLLLVFEGPDAAGKGGAIRRATQAMDARLVRVISVAAPTDEEAAHPYLWRFWRQVPRSGQVTVYDRSWYGRVLVERVEGFCTPAEWRRAYGEINDFEAQLAEAGVIVAKFWLAITAQEQLKRFRDRELTPYKQFKLTEEDWRNRDKWQAYEAAACDMIERTSTAHAPWVAIAANDKRHARLAVLEAILGRIKQG